MKALIIADRHAISPDCIHDLQRLGYVVVEKVGGREVRVEGAELRDQFAMAALTALLHSPYITSEHGSQVATNAYEYADAMLKAREAK